MKTLLIRILIFSLIAIAASFGTIAIWGLDERLPPGMSVSGWDVGGLTASEFEQGFNQKVRGVEAIKVTLRGSSAGQGKIQRVATLGELGLQMNAGAVREEIVSILKGSIWERAASRWKWRGREAALRIGVDEPKFAAKVKALWPEMYSTQPVNAKRVITEWDAVKYVPGRNAVRIEVDSLRREVAYAVGGSAGSALVQGGAEPDSFYAPRLFSERGILSGSPALTFDIPTYELKPKVTVESLKAEGIERLLAKFTTSFVTSSAGRKHNVRSTAAVVNDTLLPPGGVFDYAKVIAKTEKRYGFRQAPVILNGKLVPGIGGGICQVSTTIYNAVLRAGLEIVERRNHSLPIAYAPKGQDATYSNGNINFRWRNNTGKHLLIRTKANSSVLTVKLYGSMPTNVSYEIRSVTARTIDPPVKYVKNGSIAKGTVMLLRRGKPGYVVETYRYKRVAGKVVSREKISTDTYKAQPHLYASNAGGSSSPSRHDSRDHIVEDGVFAPVFE